MGQEAIQMSNVIKIENHTDRRLAKLQRLREQKGELLDDLDRVIKAINKINHEISELEKEFL
jgi:hypothetical protein